MKTARKVILLPNIKTLFLTYGEKNCLSLFTTNLRWDKLVSETNIFYLFIYLFCFQVNIGRIGRFYNVVHKFGRLSMLVNSSFTCYYSPKRSRTSCILEYDIVNFVDLFSIH